MNDRDEYRARPQSEPGSRKPTQQPYGVGRTMRHISFDSPTEYALQQALEILSSGDSVSIALLVKRAVRVYAENLLRSPEAYREAERAMVRQGARAARKEGA